MDHALSPYFIIAAVWNGMEHREYIGGGDKTKQKLSNWVGLGKGGAVIKGAIISKYLARVYLSNEQNKKGGKTYEPVHEISNNVVCATSKASDQPAHMRSLIRAFTSRLSFMIVKLLTEQHLEFLSLKRRLQRLVRVYTCQNATLLEISCTGSIIEKKGKGRKYV